MSSDPENSNSNSNSYSNTPGDVTPDSIGNSEHSEANRTSVAMSNALVSDLLMESPSVPRRVVRSNDPNRHRISGDRLKAMLEAQQLQLSTASGASTPSWVERGMNWWQKQSERRQRLHLQQLADEQRRKIYEADFMNHGQYSSGDRDQVQSYSYSSHEGDEAEPNDDVRPSKSGVGVSVELGIIKNDDTDNLDAHFWVPEVKIEPEVVKSFPFCPYILNQQQRQSIAVLGLPPSQAYCRWKRLYSLARDGDSFDAFLTLVEGHSHTLLVIRTTRNVIFGGYADTEWKAQHQGNPEFYGSAQAFLFRVDSDDDVHVYKWTGANRYIQYIDYKNSMLAFGGGGDVGAFGLCIEKDFQRGSSGPCATFDNEPLCDEDNFEIVDVECYGFLSGTF